MIQEMIKPKHVTHDDSFVPKLKQHENSTEDFFSIPFSCKDHKTDHIQTTSYCL